MAPAGFAHSEIHGSGGYVLLTVAYRSLSRPSSASCAKASTVCPYHLLLDGSVHTKHTPAPVGAGAIRCDLLDEEKISSCHAMQLSRYGEGEPSRPDTARLAAIIKYLFYNIKTKI